MKVLFLDRGQINRKLGVDRHHCEVSGGAGEGVRSDMGHGPGPPEADPDQPVCCCPVERRRRRRYARRVSNGITRITYKQEKASVRTR